MIVDQFPLDIWLVVARDLKDEDLLSLRLVCRYINDVIVSNHIWKPIVTSEWLCNKDEVPVQDLMQITNFAQYYRQRKRIDNHLLGLMETLNDFSVQEYWNQLWSILKYGYRAMPLCRRLISDSEVLPQRYHASILLQSLRHSSVFKMINSIVCDNNLFVHDAETILLKLSYMDPAFDNLILYREHVLKSVYRMVSGCKEFHNLSTSFKAMRLAQYFLKSIPSATSNLANSLEDYFLLRVYANEAHGDLIVLLSIVQKLCSHYEIETALTETFLIIRDDGIENGETYLTFKGRQLRIFTYKYLYKSLRTNTDLFNVNTQEKLEQLLKPISVSEFMFIIFEKSFHNNESLADMLPQGVEYNSVFPRSHLHMNSSIFHYFVTYWRLCTNISSTLNKKEFSRLVSQEYPTDVNMLYDAKCFTTEEVNAIKSDILGEPNVYKYYNVIGCEIASQHLLGQFVVSRSKPYVVIGFKEQCRIFDDHKIVFYNVIDDKMQVSVIQQQNAMPISPTAELIERFKKSPTIGHFFDHFDPSTRLFVPVSRLQQLFP